MESWKTGRRASRVCKIVKIHINPSQSRTKAQTRRVRKGIQYEIREKE